MANRLPRTEHDFSVGSRRLDLSPQSIFDASTVRPLTHEAAGFCIHQHCQIRPLHGRIEIGSGHAVAFTVFDHKIEMADAFHLGRVVVFHDRQADFTSGFDKRLRQRIGILW